MNTIRCSIIGPEVKGKLSVLEWFLKQPEGATLDGCTNHDWNSVTTLHFAKNCRGISLYSLNLPSVRHVIPYSSLSKYEMLKSFQKEYKKNSFDIKPVEASTKIGRTLDTATPEINAILWRAAGYESRLSSVAEMIAEMARYKFGYG